MKLLFASDSFKGSLTSDQTIRLLTRAAEKVYGSESFYLLKAVRQKQIYHIPGIIRLPGKTAAGQTMPDKTADSGSLHCL